MLDAKGRQVVLLEDHLALQARVEELESYLNALSRGFDRPWREDFKEWAKADGGSDE